MLSKFCCLPRLHATLCRSTIRLLPKYALILTQFIPWSDSALLICRFIAKLCCWLAMSQPWHCYLLAAFAGRLLTGLCYLCLWRFVGRWPSLLVYGIRVGSAPACNTAEKLAKRPAIVVILCCNLCSLIALLFVFVFVFDSTLVWVAHSLSYPSQSFLSLLICALHGSSIVVALTELPQSSTVSQRVLRASPHRVSVLFWSVCTSFSLLKQFSYCF